MAEGIESRLAPHDEGAESACLGSMILGGIAAVSGVVEAKDFYSRTNQVLFDALMYLYSKGGAIDIVLLRDELKRRGKFEKIGIDCLTDLVNSTPSPANALYYATTVRDNSRLRNIIQVCNLCAADAYGQQVHDVDEFCANARVKILDSLDLPSERRAALIGEITPSVGELLASSDYSHSGISTGFVELDGLLGGLHAGEMIVIAGRPSMGKTALALNIAEYVAGQTKIVVGLFSLEMGREALAERLLLKRTRIDSAQLRSGYLTTDERERLRQAGKEFNQMKLLIDDSAGLTADQIRARAEQWGQTEKPELLIIDYLQLLKASSNHRSLYEETTYQSGQMKTLARLLNIPIIVVCQLNRGPEGREGNRPRLSDLRNSGAIEQDSDVVILLHRPDYYERDKPGYKNTGKAELIIAKQRNGPTGTIELRWQGDSMSFANESVVT